MLNSPQPLSGLANEMPPPNVDIKAGSGGALLWCPGPVTCQDQLRFLKEWDVTDERETQSVTNTYWQKLLRSTEEHSLCSQ